MEDLRPRIRRQARRRHHVAIQTWAVVLKPHGGPGHLVTAKSEGDVCEEFPDPMWVGMVHRTLNKNSRIHELQEENRPSYRILHGSD
jgi:hypothetical protein